MNSQDIQLYLVLAALAGFIIWKRLKFKSVQGALPDLLKQGAAVVDVRGPLEFKQGSRPGSLNIPLGELAHRLAELDKSKPVILCCASGARSARATDILKSNGFHNVVNAGPWTNTLGGGAQ